jgi:hypothetical protein
MINNMAKEKFLLPMVKYNYVLTEYKTIELLKELSINKKNL